MRCTVLAILLVAWTAQATTAIAASVRRVTVEDTRFQVTLTDGSAMAQSALAGMVLTLGDGSGRTRRIRIDAAEPDPTDTAGDIILYTFSEQTGPHGEWQNICQPDPQGRRAGFPLPGAFTRDMRHVDASGRLLIACTGGAEAKCIRFGYKPWRTAPDGSSLAAWYQACVRLVRADYCGDGVGHTRNGTPIDIFDRIGIQRDQTAPGMSFEAAFGPDGATCIAHPRLAQEATLTRLLQLCPRLAAAAGKRCDDTAPGLLFVRSFGH